MYKTFWNKLLLNGPYSNYFLTENGEQHLFIGDYQLYQNCKMLRTSKKNKVYIRLKYYTYCTSFFKSSETRFIHLIVYT